MGLKEIIKSHKEELIKAAEASPFVVFLCGPTLRDGNPDPAARLREDLMQMLCDAGFDVVLGEDEGLEEIRLQLGMNAQDNELEFIRSKCNAVIVIAASVGAFCELGLFSWHFVHQNGEIGAESNTDFIVLVDRQFEDDHSYLNEGPVRAVDAFGKAHFVDFSAYTGEEILRRLTERRSVLTIDRRGRPKGPSR